MKVSTKAGSVRNEEKMVFLLAPKLSGNSKNYTVFFIKCASGVQEIWGRGYKLPLLDIINNKKTDYVKQQKDEGPIVYKQVTFFAKLHPMSPCCYYVSA
jgi:hypothetical protein